MPRRQTYRMSLVMLACLLLAGGWRPPRGKKQRRNTKRKGKR